MARTVRTKVYKFDELKTEQAKQKAIQWYRDGIGNDCYWLDEAMQTIKAACKAFDVQLKDWNIDPTNVNSCSWKIAVFDGWRNEEGLQELTGNRLRTYLLNNYYWIFFEGKPYGEYQKDAKGNWFYPRRSNVIFQETSCPFTGVMYDESFLDPFRKFLKQPGNETFEELVNDGIYEVCKAIEEETDYRNSDEAIIEDITANGYEFTQDGRRFTC